MGSFNASLKTIGDTRGIPATVELEEGRLSIKAGDAEIGDWPLDDVDLQPTPTGYKLAAEGDQVLLEMSDSEQFAEELSAFSNNGSRKKRSLFSRKEKISEPVVEDAPGPIEPQPEEPQPVTRETVSRIPASLIRGATATEESPVQEPAPAAKKIDSAKKPEVESSQPSRLVTALDRTIEATEKRWGPLLPGWVFNRIVFVVGFVLLALAFVFRGTTSIVLLVTGVLALMIGGAAYTDDVMASKLLPGRATPTHLMITGVGLLAVGIGFGLIA